MQNKHLHNRWLNRSYLNQGQSFEKIKIHSKTFLFLVCLCSFWFADISWPLKLVTQARWEVKSRTDLESKNFFAYVPGEQPL